MGHRVYLDLHRKTARNPRGFLARFSVNLPERPRPCGNLKERQMDKAAHSKLNNSSAARHSGLSESTLNKLRLRGDGPPFIKLGRRVLYDIIDLEEWLA